MTSGDRLVAGESLAEFHDRLGAGPRDQGRPALRHSQSHQLRSGRPQALHRGGSSSRQGATVRQAAGQEGNEVSRVVCNGQFWATSQSQGFISEPPRLLLVLSFVSFRFVPFAPCTLHFAVNWFCVIVFCYSGWPAKIGFMPFWQPSTLCFDAVSFTAVLLYRGE